MTSSPAPRKRRTVFVTAGLSASAAVIAASLAGAQTSSAEPDQGLEISNHQPDTDERA